MKFPTLTQQLNHLSLSTLARIKLITKPSPNKPPHYRQCLHPVRGHKRHNTMMTSVVEIVLVHGTQQTSMKVLRVLATTNQLHYQYQIVTLLFA